MTDAVGAYRALEYLDQIEQPTRYYTIELVTRRKNKLLDILLPTTQVEDPNSIDRAALVEAVSKILGPQIWGADKKSRRPFGGPIVDEVLDGIPLQRSLDGLPFLPTPEATDPRGRQVSFAVEESFGFEPDSVPTLDHIRALAWRLAGNVHKLGENHPVSPWHPDVQGPEWCLARVSEAVDEETFDGEPGFKLTYFFYSGAPAGLEFSRVFKNGHEVRFANSLGIPWKTCKLMYPRELTNMTGYVLLEPGRSKGRLPIFRQTTATGSHKKHNRRLHEDRRHPEKCSYGYKPDQFVSCMDCPLSYEESSESKVDIRCNLALRRNCDYGRGQNASDETTGGDEVVRASA